MTVEKLFLRCVNYCLICTAFIKVVSAFGPAEALRLPDPVLGSSYKAVFLLAAAAEMGVVLVNLLAARIEVRLAAITTFALICVWYRVCLAMTGFQGICPCMGNLYEVLRLPSRTVDFGAQMLLGCCLSGSLYFMMIVRHRVRSDGGVEVATERLFRATR